MLGAIRDAATESSRGKAGGALLRPALRGLRDELDPEAVGGSYLLGLRRLVIVCHGRFSSRGFASAIRVAERGVRERVVERTHDALEAAGALRGASDLAASVPDRA
jgi:phosphate acyltransferase